MYVASQNTELPCLLLIRARLCLAPIGSFLGTFLPVQFTRSFGLSLLGCPKKVNLSCPLEKRKAIKRKYIHSLNACFIVSKKQELKAWRIFREHVFLCKTSLNVFNLLLYTPKCDNMPVLWGRKLEIWMEWDLCVRVHVLFSWCLVLWFWFF